MARQPGSHHAAKQRDLGVQRVQQPAQRVDPRLERGGQGKPAQQLVAGLAEQVAHRHPDPAGGQDPGCT